MVPLRMLKLKDVVVSYGRVVALRGISISMSEGETVTLLGSNGAGKSTTIKAICRMVPLCAGEIWLEHERIDRLPTDEVIKRGVGLSPEGRRVFPRMTVLENLEIGAFTVQDRTIVQEQIEKVFKLFPVLKERWKQKAGTLSGGEQQMLAIGRALMARPKVLLLDEPSLGLAPIMVQRIAEAILSLKREGISILLVEQNANVALQIADRGYLIQNGEVVLEGRAKDLIVDSRVKKVYLGVAN
ncbi:ABC transporter ATP-binding protein [Moorellaceae bacterium AZ2]